MTETLTHTLGPWTVDGPPGNQIVWSGTDTRVCFLAHSNGRDDARDIAIGKLIAAAPDLLAAMKHLSDTYDNIWVKMSDGEMAMARRAWDAAEAAIAKAEGRP